MLSVSEVADNLLEDLNFTIEPLSGFISDKMAAVSKSPQRLLKQPSPGRFKLRLTVKSNLVFSILGRCLARRYIWILDVQHNDLNSLQILLRKLQEISLKAFVCFIVDYIVPLRKSQISVS